MKSICLVFVLGIALFSCKFENKSAEQKPENENAEQRFTFRENPELIKEFHTNEFLESINKKGNFENVEEIVVSHNGKTYIINLQHINDWNDPGDFLRVSIADKSENVVFEKTNFGGWVEFGNNYFLSDYVIAKNQIQSDKALLIDNKNGKQLILFGWVYASVPGLMTIIDLFPEPRIIFNKEFQLTGITNFNDSGFRNFIGTTNFENSLTLNMQDMIFE